ncbi:MAG TPA: alpha/beta hydrolase [Gemmatimonadales bacterium]|jgi:fermentation-respiration switch protein FrsA (DUF1100 family)
MFILRIVVGLALAYVALVILAWRFQDRLAFPAPRAPLSDPKRVGVANGEQLEVTMEDGTRLVGWYMDASTALHRPPPSSPALLWFYGNGETIAAIWPIVREFQPPGTAVLVVDYPGYGESAGRATEAGMYGAADAAYAALVARPGIDPDRIYVYGRSLGTAAATWVAARHRVAGVILESPFTSAAAMARQHYALLPRFILRLSLDNLGRMRQIRCPVLVFHGDADRLVPTAMGRDVAAAAAGPVELVLIHGAGHNETYDIGGREYRKKLWEFVAGTSAVGRTGGRPDGRP